jgi:hypothetical protein
VTYAALTHPWAALAKLRDLWELSGFWRIAKGGGCRMPRYFFDIKDGHRLVDPSGLNFKNDDDAIARAKVIAIGVSLDKPAVDPARHIAVINDVGQEIFKVPVYSKPAAA